MIDPAMTVSLFSGLFRVDLHPDSRGYVRFNLLRLSAIDPTVWVPIAEVTDLTCEHLEDLVRTPLAAITWINENCEQIISEDGMHLYYAFREAKDELKTNCARCGVGADAQPRTFRQRLSQALRVLRG